MNKMVKELFREAQEDWESETEKESTPGRAPLLGATRYCHKHALNTYTPCCSLSTFCIYYLFIPHSSSPHFKNKDI